MPLTSNSRVYLLTLVAYLGAFIFGYDTGVAGGVLQMRGFRQDFDLLSKSSSDLVNITSHVVSILQGGCFFGALLAAPLSEKIGRKGALLVVSIVFLVGASVQVAGTGKLSYFYSGRFLSGLGVGAMSMLGPTYVAEVAPKEVRGRITGLFQVCLTIGIAISYWIVYGVNVHFPSSTVQWRIPIGFQITPVGVMFFLLFFCRESPRWLARHNQEERSLTNLAWFRKLPIDHPSIGEEFTEILATVKEEREGRGALHECFRKGHLIRFGIAFSMFTLQQWSGQNSIGYYAPEVFTSIGIGGTNTTLFASGIYGLVKIIATTIFLSVGIEQIGRKKSLIFGAFFMGVFFFILGALFNTHQPDPKASHASSASIAMAVMIYLYVIPYCFSWGPVPWVYCSEIFSNNLRSYGVAWAAATQWLWNFVVSYVTPMLEAKLAKGGVFFFFASINIISCIYAFFLPETRGLALEEMDLLFGAVTVESRRRDRLVVHHELTGERYIVPRDNYKGRTVSVAMRDVRVRHSEPDPGESLEMGRDGSSENDMDGKSLGISRSEIYLNEASVEKHKVWTIPE
ncbi:putative high-affinity glucose transporter of the major facilitator superfamily [Hysterangium stoloniferum]|nr:putative high-affinity glucose transporter of the major facilitator superfamily [Hysterangium stoloniferum]